MCNLSQGIMEKGIKIGEAIGEVREQSRGAKGIIKMGYEFGLSEKNILSKLQENFDLSLDKAQKYLGMYSKTQI